MKTQKSVRRGGSPGETPFSNGLENSNYRIAQLLDQEGLVSVYRGRDMVGCYVAAGRKKLLAFVLTDSGMRQIGDFWPDRIAARDAVLAGNG